MLHEILLSLSGHPSPLLRNQNSSTGAKSLLSTPEQELLKVVSHLSELHCSLIKCTAQVGTSHPSVICRAVSSAVSSIHLAAFQRKILDIEDEILRKDAGLVGAYNIVPLTAVVGEVSGWTRTLEWLWDLVQLMAQRNDEGALCTGAQLMHKLRDELQTGYADIEAVALSLIKIAETTWLKQVSAWILYGRLPTFGAEDFFVQEDKEQEQGYRVDMKLMPSFMTSSTASSMLFIGVSLNRVRAMSAGQPGLGGLGHLSSQLQELSALKFPLNSAALAEAVTTIRLQLSRTTLQNILPLEKVLELLQILRQFMLLGRGEFAMALTQQADEQIRGRFRHTDDPSFQKSGGLSSITVKEGEIAAILARTWAALGAMQGEHMEEDEDLELARDILHLNLAGPKQSTSGPLNALVATPFRNLLLLSPVEMTVRIPSPLDLFLSPTDAQVYTCVNSYLLSIRRAHLRLTDLWKITRLRRHHLAPPRPPFSTTRAGTLKTSILRDRWSARSSHLRSAWTTSSAAIFLLAEIEAFLQIEIVEELWSDFQTWLVDESKSSREASITQPELGEGRQLRQESGSSNCNARGPCERPILQSRTTVEQDTLPDKFSHHDPQTLSIAHGIYLHCLTRRLLLTQPAFTDLLYDLLVHTDHLVALLHRLDGIWNSMDLEADEGIIDAFSNLEAEEVDVKSQLRELQLKIKNGVEDVVEKLRSLSVDGTFLAEMEEDGSVGDEEYHDNDTVRYKPKRTGGIDRLLMKLDFGGWFDSSSSSGAHVEDDEL